MQARIIVGESLPEEHPRHTIVGIERENWDPLILIALVVALALALALGRR